MQSADVAGASPKREAAPRPTDPASTDPAPADQVLDLIRAGRKIEAIRLYREATGADLAAAKQACEALEAGRSEPAEPPPDADQPERDRAVLDLVRGGNLIAAIKRYREATGRGLKESKEAVEALARRHGVALPKTKGCGVAAAVLSAAAVAALLAGWLAR